MCVCVCEFYATRLLFLLTTKRIIPFQGILLPRDVIITVTVALQQLDFASYLCLLLRVIVNYVSGHRRSSSCVLFFLVISVYFFFRFDFESKCKPRVSYHRDHPLDFTSIFMSVWFVSSFLSVLTFSFFSFVRFPIFDPAKINYTQLIAPRMNFAKTKMWFKCENTVQIRLYEACINFQLV